MSISDLISSFFTPWMVFALLSLFTMAGSELAQKIALTKKANIGVNTVNFYVWTLQGLGALAVSYTIGSFHIDFSTAVLLKLTINGILYYLGATLYYTSFKANSASLSIILASLSAVTSTTLGIIIFGESISLYKFVGVALVLGAILLINYQRNFSISKYNLFALAGGICFGIAYTIDKSFIIALIPPVMYVGVICIVVALVSLVIGFSGIQNDSKQLTFSDYKPLFLSALFGLLYNVFTQFAYYFKGEVGKVDAINNAMVFVVIVVEIIFFKDHSDIQKKVIAAFMATGGILLFSIK